MNRKHVTDYSSNGWCFDMRALIKALEQGDEKFILEYFGKNSQMRPHVNDMLGKLKTLVEQDLAECEEKHEQRQKHIRELHSKFERAYLLSKELVEILDSLNKDASITGNENTFYYRWLDAHYLMKDMLKHEQWYFNKMDPDKAISDKARDENAEI